MAARRAEREDIRSQFYRLFAMSDAARRGERLEGVLNQLFASDGIGIRESFRRVGEAGEGVVEQIDGVIELDGEIYLVEMKWLRESVGVDDVSRHLVRVFTRHASRGIFISYTEYTPAAISMCKEALSQAVVVLCTLSEIVLLLERDGELKSLLKAKVAASVIDKQPFRNVLGD
jgi:restriction system protein